MPASLPTGTASLPPLGGRLLAAYRLTWWALALAAVAVCGFLLFEPQSHPAILALRLTKSIVLLAVSAILFRRRARDPVAAMLGISFLLWTVSSSVDFAASTSVWPAVLDRCRFLPFAMALLLFPNGEWRPRWTRVVAAAIILVFVIGTVEALGLLPTRLYLPLAIACVLMAMGALFARYRSQSVTAQQQLKWVMLGLVAGISLILSARAGAALAPKGPMPMASAILHEGLFQLGIVVIALGFLTSLLRYRLYDAEAAISRSAAYAGLTLALVGTFAASEAIIQTLGQRYFGEGIGDLSGGIAAAIAAVLLTPLHGRISNWAEQHFQRDLIGLKTQLPDLLAALSGGSSVPRLGSVVLPHIEQAVHSARIALLVDGRLMANRGMARAAAQRWVRQWAQPIEVELFDQGDDEIFPLKMALRCPFGSVRAWLLLGPRPDGSFHGQDELDALQAIAPPFQRTLFAVAERQAAQASERKQRRSMGRSIVQLSDRLALLECKLDCP